MSYALVRSNTIEQVGPPRVWFDGTRWWDFRTANPATYAAAGWLPVTDAPRPADTASTTWDRAVALVAGVPTVTWTERAKTAEETAAATAASNDTTLRAQVTDALATNQTILTAAAAYLAGHITLGANPTNAQVIAAVKAYGDQVRALTQAAQIAARQRTKLARLVCGLLDGTD